MIDRVGTARENLDAGEACQVRRAVAYLRASTKKQHLSCGDQLAAIEDYCRREGLSLTKVFTDDGVSGMKARSARAAWDELLNYVEAGHLGGGVVVVWSLDRWARDFRAGLLAAWTVGDFDVELHTTDAGRVDLNSVEGQLMGTLKLALAAQESRERSRRVREEGPAPGRGLLGDSAAPWIRHARHQGPQGSCPGPRVGAACPGDLRALRSWRVL